MSLFQRLWDWIRGKHPEFQFPAVVRQAGEAAQDYAYGAIRPKERLPGRLEGSLVLREAGAVINGIPCWYDERWQAYVGGVCTQRSGGRVEITIAHRNGQPGMVHIPTVRHEFGHGWLFCRKIYGHDPRFDAVFDGWRETRQTTGVSMGTGWMHVQTPESIDMVEADGTHTHVDLVSLPVVAAGAMEEPSA